MRRTSSLDAARYLRRAGSSRYMREESMLVRETAREQLEERQSDWAYSRPVVVLDLVWNLAFVVVAAAILVLSRDEKPPAPLRVWVIGYALQCVVHMLCVWSEYQRRRRRDRLVVSLPGRGTVSPAQSPERGPGEPATEGATQDPPIVGGDVSVEIGDVEEEEGAGDSRSMAKRLESANTMFSFAWWVVGFYWILSGVGLGFPNAPLLSWLCTVFLAFDVFFVVFCVALACVIGIAVCCCLPCIIAILYAVADQEGASEEEINTLPKFKYQMHPAKKASGREGADAAASKAESKEGGSMMLLGNNPQGKPAEQSLKGEDAECCICLAQYDDGVELRQLPCMHHFHCTCIDKWLRTKPTCPLCKYNVVKGKEPSSSSAATSSVTGSDASGSPEESV